MENVRQTCLTIILTFEPHFYTTPLCFSDQRSTGPSYLSISRRRFDYFFKTAVFNVLYQSKNVRTNYPKYSYTAEVPPVANKADWSWIGYGMRGCRGCWIKLKGYGMGRQGYSDIESGCRGYWIELKGHNLEIGLEGRGQMENLLRWRRKRESPRARIFTLVWSYTGTAHTHHETKQFPAWPFKLRCCNLQASAWLQRVCKRIQYFTDSWTEVCTKKHPLWCPPLNF